MNNSIVLQCKNLSKSFQQGELQVEVLKSVHLTLHAQQSIAIVGSSGCGKSTLLNCLAGLENSSHGFIELLGTDLTTLTEKKRSDLRNKQLGFIYQFHHLLPEFTARENVAMPLLLRRACSRLHAYEKAEVLLERVGMSHRRHHKPGELSGGERQRAAIARALVNNPHCVFADEPTGNLDNQTAAVVTELILQLQQESDTSFIVVTHDNALAAKMDCLYSMHNGNLQNNL